MNPASEGPRSEPEDIPEVDQPVLVEPEANTIIDVDADFGVLLTTPDVMPESNLEQQALSDILASFKEVPRAGDHPADTEVLEYEATNSTTYDVNVIEKSGEETHITYEIVEQDIFAGVSQVDDGLTLSFIEDTVTGNSSYIIEEPLTERQLTEVNLVVWRYQLKRNSFYLLCRDPNSLMLLMPILMA